MDRARQVPTSHITHTLKMATHLTHKAPQNTHTSLVASVSVVSSDPNSATRYVSCHVATLGRAGNWGKTRHIRNIGTVQCSVQCSVPGLGFDLLGPGASHCSLLRLRQVSRQPPAAINCQERRFTGSRMSGLIYTWFSHLTFFVSLLSLPFQLLASSNNPPEQFQHRLQEGNWSSTFRYYYKGT